ncbi:hypothetical protein D7Y55_13420 [Stenotrophomonas maltophilia]|nr:hypothetical protein [Stenotrophomonas maltophilia]
MHVPSTRALIQIHHAGGVIRRNRCASMNTPGKPKPSWRQRNVLMAALAAVLVIVLVILFIPW